MDPKGWTISQREGFSLVELMVSVSLFVVLSIAAAGVFDSSQESMNWQYHQLTLQKELRRILSTMTQEIRESSPSSPLPVTVGANAITFQIPNQISGNQITGWTSINYGLGPDNTVTRTANGQTTAIGNSVQTLGFVYPLNPQTAPRTVRIQITGSRTTLKRTITSSVTGEATLRN